MATTPLVITLDTDKVTADIRAYIDRKLAELEVEGRLLPAGGEVSYQWGVQWPDKDVVSYGDDEKMARHTARLYPDAQLVRRADRRWPDGSRYIGGLQPVEDPQGPTAPGEQ